MTSRKMGSVQPILTLLLLALSLTAFGLVGYNWHLSRSLAVMATGPALDYGAQVDSNALRRALKMVGYRGELDQRAHLLLYFFRPGHFQHLKSIKYGEVLRQRHADNGLEVFGVTDAQPGEVERLRAGESLSLPVLYDKGAFLGRLLRVQESYEHTFLINPNGEVVFSLDGAPQEDLIRQIVEKYVAGKIDYEVIQANQVYKVGQPLSALRVAPLSGGSDFDLEARNIELILISARCTSCQLNSYVKWYHQMADLAPDPSRYVIFSNRYPQDEITTMLMGNGIQLRNFYVSRDSLGGLENEYQTKSGDDSAVRVTVDNRGIITSVKPLTSLN